MKMTVINLTRASLLLVSLCTLLFLSCDEQNELSVQNDDLIEDINDDVSLESSFEEIDDLSLAGASHDFSTGGRTESDGRFSCAELTKEEIEGGVIITIDFGDGCEGPHGMIRAGMIKVTKIGNHWIPGSILTAELVDFSIDGLGLEGTRSVKNVSESMESSPTFEVKLAGGKATWEDETIATREVDRIRTLVRADNQLGDEVHITGVSNGMNRRGVDYEVLIQEYLVFKRIYRTGGRFIPVSGIKQITKGDKVVTIDFGEGECDNIATKTVGGVSNEITIRRRK